MCSFISPIFQDSFQDPFHGVINGVGISIYIYVIHILLGVSLGQETGIALGVGPFIILFKNLVVLWRKIYISIFLVELFEMA